jgi:hypothetical protein
VNAYKGQNVIIVGVHSNGASDQAAIVTRVWMASAPVSAAVNLAIFPDMASSTFRPSVDYYESLEAANKANARLPFCYPATP